MRIIVDSNRLISALIKKGVSRKILSSKNIDFYSIDYVMGEVDKYRDIIEKKSKMSKEEVDTLFSMVMENIDIVSEEEVKANMKEAKKIMDDIDPKDTPFIAAALAISSDIWSHDKHFEKQNKVKCWLAKDLLKFV